MVYHFGSLNKRVKPSRGRFTFKPDQERFVLDVLGLIIKRDCLLYCNAFCKVSRFVNVVSAEHSSVIGQ